MATVTTVHVDYRKLVSDREYGNEQAAVSLTATLVAGDNPDEVARQLHDRARTLVIQQLKASPSRMIRLTLETDQERDTRRAQERADWEAHSAALPAADEDEDEDEDEHDDEPPV